MKSQKLARTARYKYLIEKLFNFFELDERNDSKYIRRFYDTFQSFQYKLCYQILLFVTNGIRWDKNFCWKADFNLFKLKFDVQRPEEFETFSSGDDFYTLTSAHILDKRDADL